MSDTNDKKPAPSLAGWPSSPENGSGAQPHGHGAEDPLAQLDRILGENSAPTDSHSTAQGLGQIDDLQSLENEILRELRGVQHNPQETAPQVDNMTGGFGSTAPAPQVTAADVQPDMPVAGHGYGSLSQPNVAEPAPVQQPVMPSATAPGQYADPVVDPNAGLGMDYAPVQETGLQDPMQQYAPAVEESSLTAGGYPGANPHAASDRMYGAVDPAPMQPVAEQPAVQETYYSPEPAAPAEPLAPASYAPAPQVAEPAAPAAPSLDSWSSLLQQTSAPETQAPAVAPNVADSVPAAPSADMGMTYAPVSSEPAAATPQAPEVDSYYAPQPEAPVADPMAGFSAGQPAGFGQAATQQPAEPVAPAPAVESGFAAGTAGSLLDRFSSENSVSSSGFGQQPAQPTGYETADYAAAAPQVDVTGQSVEQTGHVAADYYNDPNAAVGQYNAPAGYAVQGGQAADMGGGVTPDMPMASGPHGTYSDPNVAQAAAEAMPYAQDNGYAAQADQMTDEKPAKSKKGLVMAAAAAGLLIAGGAGLWAFGGDSSSSNGETPVIAANTDPVKEVPSDPGGKVIPHQNKEVYSRIDGSKNDEGPNNLMPASEKPLAMTSDGRSPRVISLDSNKTGAAPVKPSAPKQVRTVIVRPDGTFVQSGGDQQTSNQLTSVDKQLMAATPSEQAMNQTFNNGIAGLPSGGPAVGGTGAAQQAVTTNQLPKRKPANLLPAPSVQAAIQPTPQPVAPAQRPRSIAPPAAPAPAAPARQQASTGSGGYTVQVTSQRSPEQARAAYATIQSRLSSVLGGYQPDIQRADLGAKGIYYRVRVGSFGDRGRATSFCQSIKAAGGDCIVKRR